MNAMPRKYARVLFDEVHSESWSISAERARQMQPEDPANASYQRAADALAARDFLVRRNLDAPLSPDVLAGADVLALVHPCDPRWERTTSAHPPALSAKELDAVLGFVRADGGLLVITEYEHDKYGDNLNELLAPAGLRLENGKVFDRSACALENPEWFFAAPAEGSPLGHRAGRACFYRAGWIASGAADWRASAQAHPAEAGVIATARFGEGRIVVVTDSVLFGDERFGAFDHAQLWLNIVHWLAVPAFARSAVGTALRAVRCDAQAPGNPPPSVDAERESKVFMHADADGRHGVPSLPRFAPLKASVNALRELQESNGAVVVEKHAAAARLVEAILAQLDALRPDFPHQTEYFEALVRDFTTWRGAGFGRPDFAASLAAFHPERQRRDGIENLVVFPLYTPNASGDTRFEALVLRTPWPDWLDELERTRFHNDKFVPGHLAAFTAGYDSECAVLFPETIALTGRAPNHFAVILCDREARRLQRCARECIAAVRLDVFPELECWLAALPLMQDTLALWDLMHDTAHSAGELPFDPFMIRQRAPFWMYGLEELRVDLRAFGEAVRLAEAGIPFARYVTWAILLDRIFRFPLTGPRVRNYDALGGQLLFAYLHQKDVLVWSDNRLTIRWDALAEGVGGLREELRTLYKLGADCSKMRFWLAAHDLVSRYVPPNVGSRWQRNTRAFADESDPRAAIALVSDDEFPLGNFHLNLRRKFPHG